MPAPGTFIIGLAVICLVVWVLYLLMNENHMSLLSDCRLDSRLSL